MTKTIKLIAKTGKARAALNKIFDSYKDWKGYWYVLDTHKVESGEWFKIAPLGHPWDKFERWVNSTNDASFTVVEVL